MSNGMFTDFTKTNNGRPGIYEIVNQHSGRRYIGCSTDMGSRMYVHVKMLESGNHHCSELQHAWSLGSFEPRVREFASKGLYALEANHIRSINRYQLYNTAIPTGLKRESYNRKLNFVAKCQARPDANTLVDKQEEYAYICIGVSSEILGLIKVHHYKEKGTGTFVLKRDLALLDEAWFNLGWPTKSKPSKNVQAFVKGCEVRRMQMHGG